MVSEAIDRLLPAIYLQSAMFVRRTQTRATANGDRYFTYHLVRSERRGAHVRQRTLLNLGRHFSLPHADWPLLCSRIKQLDLLVPAYCATGDWAAP